MKAPEMIHLYFDYVDPGSFLMERAIRAMEEARGTPLVLEPFEIRPPPRSLLDPEAGEWRAHLDAMSLEGERAGLRFARPWLVPWTRKAHELSLFAREHGCLREIHDALFRVYLLEGQDIGRIDVLVEVAREAGLDRVEAKAVLDVDRFRPEVERKREGGLAMGIAKVPTLLWRGRSLEGYHREDRLMEFLAPSGHTEQP